jgi:hypothetical protein
MGIEWRRSECIEAEELPQLGLGVMDRPTVRALRIIARHIAKAGEEFAHPRML